MSGGGTMRGMGDGEKLRRLIDERKVSQTKLAKHLGVTPTSIGRYLKWLTEGTIKDEQWIELAAALRKEGIDPTTIRPVPSAPTRIRSELVPLLDAFTTKEQLDALLAVIDADDDSRESLRLVLVERLRWVKG